MLDHFSKLWDRLRNDEDGASLVEYGLLVSLIALAVILSLTAIGTNLSGLFSKIAANIQ